MKTFHRILITITLVLLGGIPLCASSKAIIITEKNAIIKKNKFTAYFDTEDNFFIKNSKNKIIFQSKEMTHDFDFIDFNKDGNLDLIVKFPTSTANELFLFDNKKRTLRRVNNFSDFPAPIHIRGTKYYYSYHSSGCADSCWDSDLFYLKNFKAVRIGNISADYFNDDGKIEINTYKMTNARKTLIKNYPSDKILSKYKEYKWGFIEDYWNKNYLQFE